VINLSFCAAARLRPELITQRATEDGALDGVQWTQPVAIVRRSGLPADVARAAQRSGTCSGYRDPPLPRDGECAFVALRIGESSEGGLGPLTEPPAWIADPTATSSGCRDTGPFSVPTTGARTGGPKDLAEGRNSSSLGLPLLGPTTTAQLKMLDQGTSATELQPPLASDDRGVSEFAMSRRLLACRNGTLVVAGPAGRWMGAA
jgi:hypothetical protein